MSAPFLNLSDSEEELVSEGLTELLIAQRAAIRTAEDALNAYEAEGGADPVRISAEHRIQSSLIDRRERIEALIRKLFD